MGIGEEAVRAVAPDIVYVSIAGFGFDGPYAQKPVYDPLIQALSGLTTVQGGSDRMRPRLVRTILPDKLTGVEASQAIVAALFARERTGKGQHVRLAMLDAIIAFLWHSDMTAHTFVGREPDEDAAQSFIDLIFETADGHVAVSALGDKEWAGLTRALDRPEWREDPRFKTAALRDANKDARLTLTQAALAPLSSAEVLARLEAEDVPCAPVLTRREMIRHPQVLANGILAESDHPVAGRLRQARPPARFSLTDPEHRRGGPRLGEDTEAVLREAGLGDGEIAALIAAGVAAPAIEEEETA
jgi:crotonobetainyl-CoA:carnitine CoA-transferase CaiB-like acyl-CoA transferase